MLRCYQLVGLFGTFQAARNALPNSNANELIRVLLRDYVMSLHKIEKESVRNTECSPRNDEDYLGAGF